MHRQLTPLFCKLGEAGRPLLGTVWGREAADIDLKERMQATGFAVERLTMHSPRHTGMTLLRRAGVTKGTVTRRIGGWALRPESGEGASEGYNQSEEDPTSCCGPCTATSAWP